MNNGSTAFKDYWRVFWSAIVTTVAGLRVTWKYLFSRPITVEYPDVLPEVPDGWRGWHAYEVDRCIMCGLCVKACPIQCITLETEGAGKERRVKLYQIHYGLCLYCNLCAEVCPVVCLWMTRDWDLACYRRGDVVVRFDTMNANGQRTRLWPGLLQHPLRAEKKPAKPAASAAPGVASASAEAVASRKEPQT